MLRARLRTAERARPRRRGPRCRPECRIEIMRTMGIEIMRTRENNIRYKAGNFGFTKPRHRCICVLLFRTHLSALASDRWVSSNSCERCGQFSSFRCPECLADRRPMPTDAGAGQIVSRTSSCSMSARVIRHNKRLSKRGYSHVMFTS